MKEMNVGLIGFLGYEANQMRQYIKFAMQKQPVHFFTFEDMEEISKKYCPYYDIIFLDAQSLASTWEPIMQMIRDRDDPVYAVLVSSSLNIANKGYKYNVKSHLLKPLTLLDIVNEIEKYKDGVDSQDLPFLWLTTKKGRIKLYFHKLRYIQADDHLMLIHYDKEVIKYRRKQTLANFMEILPTSQFFLCYRSYIVNLTYIEEIFPEGSRYGIRLKTGEQLPLSRNLNKALLLALKPK